MPTRLLYLLCQYHSHLLFIFFMRLMMSNRYARNISLLLLFTLFLLLLLLLLLLRSKSSMTSAHPFQLGLIPTLLDTTYSHLGSMLYTNTSIYTLIGTSNSCMWI